MKKDIINYLLQFSIGSLGDHSTLRLLLLAMSERVLLFFSILTNFHVIFSVLSAFPNQIKYSQGRLRETSRTPPLHCNYSYIRTLSNQIPGNACFP